MGIVRFPIEVPFPLSSPPRDREKIARMASVYCHSYRGLSLPDLRWHLFDDGVYPGRPRVSRVPTLADDDVPMLVASFQFARKPYAVKILGVHNPQMSANLVLQWDVPDEVRQAPLPPLPELPIVHPEPPIITNSDDVDVPEFFAFTDAPGLPETVQVPDLSDACYLLWSWLGRRGKHSSLPPIKNGLEQVAFYMIVVATIDDTETLINTYAEYLREKCAEMTPDWQSRRAFAARKGFHISGPDELEQKLLSVVRDEAGILRDNRDLWECNISPKLESLMEVIRDWVMPGKKRSKLDTVEGW